MLNHDFTTAPISTELAGRSWRARKLLLALRHFAATKPLGAVGGAILIFLISVALLAPLISPHDPIEPNANLTYAGPSPGYPLGNDHIGRDVLSRLFHGARISLYVGGASVGIGITLGALLGIISAYSGGIFDLLFQRLVDALIAFPTIILALAIMSALGGSPENVIIALVSVLAPTSARTMRSQVLSLKEWDFVTAARAIGASPMRIILRHIVPNCLPTYIILLTLTLGLAITAEASLSFLGVGVPPDVPTWGGMLTNASQSFVVGSPWLAIYPGVALALVVFGSNLLGDALRDVLDPRLRGTR